jgi:hypothetical protein
MLLIPCSQRCSWVSFSLLPPPLPQPYESLLADVVEFIHTHTVSTKVFRSSSWRREANTLAEEGLLVCRGKFKLTPLDYGAIQFHCTHFNF